MLLDAWLIHLHVHIQMTSHTHTQARWHTLSLSHTVIINREIHKTWQKKKMTSHTVSSQQVKHKLEQQKLSRGLTSDCRSCFYSSCVNAYTSDCDTLSHLAYLRFFQNKISVFLPKLVLIHQEYNQQCAWSVFAMPAEGHDGVHRLVGHSTTLVPTETTSQY